MTRTYGQHVHYSKFVDVDVGFPDTKRSDSLIASEYTRSGRDLKKVTGLHHSKSHPDYLPYGSLLGGVS